MLPSANISTINVIFSAFSAMVNLLHVSSADKSARPELRVNRLHRAERYVAADYVNPGVVRRRRGLILAEIAPAVVAKAQVAGDRRARRRIRESDLDHQPVALLIVDRC